MHIDAQMQLSSAQALSATGVSTNAIDLGSASPVSEIGSGEPMVAMIKVDVAADFTTTDETYEFQIIQSANANLSSADVLSKRAVVATLLKLNSLHFVGIPPGMITKRYLGLNYVLAGTTPSITVTAYIMPQNMVDTYKSYAKGYTIS